MHESEYSIIESKIKKIDEQIAMLTKLKSQYAEKLNGLTIIEVAVPKPTDNNQAPINNALLFREYFLGREDVYAKMWINNRTGKRGYSPVCKNEWVRTLCRKPATRCSECPNQQFLPFDEIAIQQHLEGRQVIGVYPMLKNENCHFLAIDFDRESWLEDIRAIMTTCRDEGLPAVVERSRSGSGGDYHHERGLSVETRVYMAHLACIFASLELEWPYNIGNSNIVSEYSVLQYYQKVK